MAIITTLVGLGVLLVFTVLGCVLEVFLGQEGEHMAGTGPAYPRRPVCGGDGAELYSCAGYTLEPGVGRRAGGIPGFGHPGFFAADGVLYLPQWQAPEKAAGKNECAGSVMPACGGILCIQRERRPVPGLQRGRRAFTQVIYFSDAKGS